MLLHSIFTGHNLVGERDVDEADDARLKSILRRLCDDDELLVALRRQCDNESFLQFLTRRVFDVPAVMLELTVLDEAAVLVGEGQLVTVVRAKDFVTVEVRRARDRQLDGLILAAQVAEEQRRAENLTADELAVVDDIGIDVDHRVDVDLGSCLCLSDRLDLLLEAVDLCEQCLPKSFRLVLVSLRLLRVDDFLRAGFVGSLNIDMRLLLFGLLLQLPHSLDR